MKDQKDGDDESLVCSICNTSVMPPVPNSWKRDIRSGEVTCEKCILVAAAGADSEIIDAFSDQNMMSPGHAGSDLAPSDVAEDPEGSLPENCRTEPFEDDVLPAPTGDQDDLSQPQTSEGPTGGSSSSRGIKRKGGKSGKMKGVSKSGSSLKQGITGKSRSRRSIFKRCTYQSPTSYVTPVTSDCTFFRGVYYQTGDIISMTDMDGGVYYAQIRGFLEDQYCEKSAAVTWLIPTSEAPEDGSFDPSSYILGPEEDEPRKLECMDFVLHAPSDYFKNRTAPYPTASSIPEAGFIWTRFGFRTQKPDEKRPKSQKEEPLPQASS